MPAVFLTPRITNSQQPNRCELAAGDLGPSIIRTKRRRDRSCRSRPRACRTSRNGIRWISVRSRGSRWSPLAILPPRNGPKPRGMGRSGEGM